MSEKSIEQRLDEQARELRAMSELYDRSNSRQMAVKIRAEARLQEGAAAELRRLREENAKLREMLRQALVDFAHVDGLKSEAMRAETARRESAEALLRHWDAYSDVEAHFARYAKASPDASPPDAPGSP